MPEYPAPGENGNNKKPRLSYKFQRLREQIRQAIAGGEFKGQLPGERCLGRRFNANAKTINKALCDLSREGLLVRHIGRGTFVAGSEGTEGRTAGRSFQALLPHELVTSPHNMAMLSLLRESFTAGGFQLDTIEIDTTANAGTIQLADWPSGIRRAAGGMVCFPIDPLSNGCGRFSDDCLLETMRRQVPVVSIGGCSAEVRTSAVMPDFIDAGFRLGEHLLLAGCDTLIVLKSIADGRETNWVANGCHLAAIRHGRPAPRETIWSESASALNETDPRATVGVLCVGAAAFDAALRDTTLQRVIREGRAVVCTILEPGDTRAEKAAVTSYEVEPRTVARWATRLLIESRPGQRPVEVLVPGTVAIRGSDASPEQTIHRRNTMGERRTSSVQSVAEVAI